MRPSGRRWVRARRAWCCFRGPALAQEAQPELEEVVVVGTRTAGRSLDESLAPVDLVTPEAIRRSAAIPGEVGAAIQSLVPSFNLPRQSNSNFADLVRPAQLRNLSPDQVLVLVNGKRRHTTATLTTESKLGKGTSPVDFNSIPVGAIKRIEVLRDGAGAQYGSDAIAGVINVVLKDADEGGEATASWGQNRTDFKPTGRSVNDGDTLFASVNSGFAVGGGFLNLTAEYRDRDQTLRSGPDQIPFFEEQTPANLALAGTQTHKAGDGPMDDISFMYNAAFPLGDALEVYSFGSYADRNGEGANFFRYPDSFANVPSIFPDGYIPVLEADNVDLSLAAGLRGTLASDWSWDLSAVYGSNDFDHDVTNSLNVSFGDASPTSFNVGEYKYAQTIVRFDMSRPFDVGGLANPLNLAWGLEYRNEGYETEAGDPESYEAGPVIGAPIGTQAGSGLKPEETVDVDRDAVSAYRRSRDEPDRALPGRRGRAIRGLQRLRQLRERQDFGPLRADRRPRGPRHGGHGLPRAVAHAGVLPRLDHELRRGRPARERPEPADRRPDRGVARRAGPRCRGVASATTSASSSTRTTASA